MELAVKSQTPEVLELMAQENALTSAYQKLYASAQIPFRGRTLTVAQLAKYKTNADRAVRKAAYEAEGAWFDAHREEFDSLYDQLVKNRTAQAQAMGYENFVPLGAIRMNRLGYTLDDMAAYRAQVKRDVVPVVAKLKRLQYARTGISQPKFYDDAFCFKEGNPAPHGTPEEILAAGKKMYHELSPETSAFIDEMFENELFDVLGKAGQGARRLLHQPAGLQAAVIFSNFNGTAGDVDVLTHEAGHAFADYVAQRKDIPAILREPRHGKLRDSLHEHGVPHGRFPPPVLWGRNGALRACARRGCPVFPSLRRHGGRVPAHCVFKPRPHARPAQR